MSKELRLRVVEFEPGMFHAEYKGRFFWRNCYYDCIDQAEVYYSKEAAEEDLRRFRRQWNREQAKKRWIPQEWRYPPNTLDRS
jgi:hypothetical protein